MPAGTDATIWKDGSEWEGEITNWTMTKGGTTDEYGSNESGDGTTVKAGRKHTTGTITCKDNPAVEFGDEITAIFYDDVKSYSGSIVVQSCDENVDIDKGTQNTWTINYAFNGAMTEATTSAP